MERAQHQRRSPGGTAHQLFAAHSDEVKGQGVLRDNGALFHFAWHLARRPTAGVKAASSNIQRFATGFAVQLLCLWVLHSADCTHIYAKW